MKPRLIMFRGVWHCGIRVGKRMRPIIGLGFTARAAYKAWEAMQC
jgi:hypothetical protein